MTRQLKLKAAELLERGGLVIATGDWWTQTAYARDENDNKVPAGSSGACRFCAVGVLWAQQEEGVDGVMVVDTAWRRLDDLSGAGGASYFNDADGRTHTEVAFAMLQAAENLRKEAGEV